MRLARVAPAMVKAKGFGREYEKPVDRAKAAITRQAGF